MIERTNNPADARAQPDAAAYVHDVVLSLLRSEKAGCLLDVPAGEGAFAAHAKELGCEVSTRGRSQVLHDKARVHVRELVLSEPLLFGEILIVYARKL